MIWQRELYDIGNMLGDCRRNSAVCANSHVFYALCYQMSSSCCAGAEDGNRIIACSIPISCCHQGRATDNRIDWEGCRKLDNFVTRLVVS